MDNDQAALTTGAAALEFDESYFTSDDTGSAYRENNYLESALLSRLYYEMAENIAGVFRPRKVLEVGCAAGPVVYYLNNFFEVEAYGIDVSPWAIKHRFHDNVTLNSAHELPFGEGEFDLVFSCHALEHVQPESIGATLSELSRVCHPEGVQFHLLPVLGSTSYSDKFGGIVALRRDPTHRLLFDRQWWRKRWASVGWSDTNLRLAHVHDNPTFEMSECQFILSRSRLRQDTVEALATRNFSNAAAFHSALNRTPPPGLEAYLKQISEQWQP